jgi:hypothetical protein
VVLAALELHYEQYPQTRPSLSDLGDMRKAAEGKRVNVVKL